MSTRNGRSVMSDNMASSSWTNAITWVCNLLVPIFFVFFLFLVFNTILLSTNLATQLYLQLLFSIWFLDQSFQRLSLHSCPILTFVSLTVLTFHRVFYNHLLNYRPLFTSSVAYQHSHYLLLAICFTILGFRNCFWSEMRSVNFSIINNFFSVILRLSSLN